jgi:acyl-coenzyme A thioesterase 13
MYLGVSRTLNCTYLKPIPCGSTIDIQCEILSIGKRLCTTRGEMRAVNEDDTVGSLLAVCEHGKVSTDAQFEKL